MQDDGVFRAREIASRQRAVGVVAETGCLHVSTTAPRRVRRPYAVGIGRANTPLYAILCMN